MFFPTTIAVIVATRIVHCADCVSAGFTYVASVNGCYGVVTRRLQWTDAGQRCRTLHKSAHLLVINDAQEQSAVGEMLTAVNRQCQFNSFLPSVLHLVAYCEPRYRATLSVSAVFAVARGVRPSVRQCTFVYCIHKAEDIFKFLTRPGSPITSFLTPAPVPNSKGNPFSGGAKYTGVGKIISETVRCMHLVAMGNVNRKS